MISEDTKSLFRCTFGKQSHVNLFGKIILSPVMLIILTVWIVCDTLFSKREKPARSLNEYDFPLVQCDSEGEIFCITPESRIYSDGVDITQDDAAIAKCFKRWVKIWGNIGL